MPSTKPVTTNPFEVEESAPVSRSELLDALDSLIQNYERARQEGSWAARELAALLAVVQKNLGVTRVHCARMVDQVCERVVSIRRTTRTADDRPFPFDDALDSVVAELGPFLPDLHDRLIAPEVKKALLMAARTYAQKPSDVERAEAVYAVICLVRSSWAKRTSVDGVRKTIIRARKKNRHE